MNIKWTSKAFADIGRLYEFLAAVNEDAAVRAIATLTAAPSRLARYPRIGEQLFEFTPREVRRILVGHYEMRYEMKDGVVYILRIWHTREKRT